MSIWFSNVELKDMVHYIILTDTAIDYYIVIDLH